MSAAVEAGVRRLDGAERDAWLERTIAEHEAERYEVLRHLLFLYEELGGLRCLAGREERTDEELTDRMLRRVTDGEIRCDLVEAVGRIRQEKHDLRYGRKPGAVAERDAIRPYRDAMKVAARDAARLHLAEVDR